MISPDSKVALVIGHPGHELRVHRFMEIYTPVVYVLTDGSGSTGTSRLSSTLQIIRNTGCTEGSIMGRFTDKEIYQLIYQKETHVFRALAHELAAALEVQQIEVVVGDSNEGFCPTHDLCRYLINAAVKIYKKRIGKSIPNYEFYLEAAPNKFPDEKTDALLRIQLNEVQFERKFKAALEYPELAFELKRFLEKYGKKSFQIEYLWPVNHFFDPVGWKGAMPEYDAIGRQRVTDGVYNATINFTEHMLPLAQQLNDEDTLYQ